MKLFLSVFLLLSVLMKGSARPSTNGGISERQLQLEERDSEEQISTSDGKKRQKAIARDTFLRLNPNPRKTADHRAQQPLRSPEGDGNSAEDPVDGRPLRDGNPVLTLTSAVDVLNRTATVAANNCRGDLFKHKLRVPGCKPKTLHRRFCHGSCASFYIPRLRSKKLKATFQSCAACVPVETDLIRVRLDCEEGELYRTIVRVKRCACRNVVLDGDEEESEGGVGAEKVAEGGEHPAEVETAIRNSNSL